MQANGHGRKVVFAGVGYTLGNYLLKGISFLTIPLFARLLSTSDYGMYNTVFAYEGILYILIGCAIHSSYKNARYKYKYTSEGAESGKDYYSYVSTTVVFVLLNVIIWLILANIFKNIIQSRLGIDVYCLNLIILYSFSSAIVTCYNTDLSLNYKYGQFIKISAINALSSIGLSVILVVTVFSNRRYLGRLLGVTIPILFIAGYIILVFIKRAKPQNIKSFLKWGIKYSLPIVPHGLGQAVLNQFDTIMISSMVGLSFSGIYSFGYNIYSIIRITSTSLDSVWNPWFYEQMAKEDYDNIKNKSNIYIILMSLFSCCVIFISPEIIKFLGTKEFYDASYCVIPIIAGGFFSFLYTLPACVEYYYEKTNYIAIGTLAAAILNILLNYVGIKTFGYVAAAYTTLITYILYFCFHYIIASKIMKKSLFDNKVIVISSIGVLFNMIIANSMIGYYLVRWILAVSFGIILILYEEKHMSIINLILNKFGKKDKK